MLWGRVPSCWRGPRRGNIATIRTICRSLRPATSRNQRWPKKRVSRATKGGTQCWQLDRWCQQLFEPSRGPSLRNSTKCPFFESMKRVHRNKRPRDNTNKRQYLMLMDFNPVALATTMLMAVGSIRMMKTVRIPAYWMAT